MVSVVAVARTETRGAVTSLAPVGLKTAPVAFNNVEVRAPVAAPIGARSVATNVGIVTTGEEATVDRAVTEASTTAGTALTVAATAVSPIADTGVVTTGKTVLTVNPGVEARREATPTTDNAPGASDVGRLSGDVLASTTVGGVIVDTGAGRIGATTADGADTSDDVGTRAPRGAASIVAKTDVIVGSTDAWTGIKTTVVKVEGT